MTGLCLSTIAVWWHNHDILRDLFDYSTVITAAGKIEAGFKPYTGVRSPMQSSVYLFNAATEKIFGSTYLGLTAGGLVQALGGGFLIIWMLRRSLGLVGATLIAAAVVMAGLLQHVVFFYNPIGILCYGLVLFGLARQPRLWPIFSTETVIVYAALIIGGLNKINFQGVTLLVAAFLSLHAWQAAKMGFMDVVRNAVILALIGLIIPLAFELLWSGATFTQWFGQVVGLPSVRREYLSHIFDWDLYLKPVHDFHHHIIFGAIGGFGFLLLVGISAAAVIDGRLNQARFGSSLLTAVLLLACCLSGAVIMITNHESVMLTSLTYLLSAVAILIAGCKMDSARGQWMRRMVVVASLAWTGFGGYAAWHGSRVLYAQDPPPRSEYARVVQPVSPLLRYFEGVQLEKGGLQALQALAGRLESFEDKDGRLRGVLFGPGLEWMERAHPETIVPMAPIWYHAGTSLTEADGDYFKQLLAHHGNGRLVTHVAWQAWPVSVWAILASDYRAELVASRYIIYHPRREVLNSSQPPVALEIEPILSQPEFRTETVSNIFLAKTAHTLDMALYSGKGGKFFGRNGSSFWKWPFGVHSLAGRAIARLNSLQNDPVEVVFSIIAGDPVAGELLWETSVMVEPGHSDIELPFSLQPGGRPLYFQTNLSGVGFRDVTAGWSHLRIAHAGAFSETPPVAFNPGLRLIERTGKDEPGSWFARTADAVLAGGWTKVPAENWRRYEVPIGHFTADVDFEVNAANPADPVVVTLAWYRAGRFEIVTEKLVDLRVASTVALEGNLPEPTGWLGVLTRPAGGAGIGHAARIRTWEVR